jgi:transcriptional regulator
MYTPREFNLADEAIIFSFIERYDFATLVTASPGDGILISHIPLILQQTNGRASLAGHLARGNPHWRSFNGITESVAIFRGPHGYVSPGWYKTGPAVPTWNYAVVHVHGRPRTNEIPEMTSTILENLVRKYESHRPDPWKTEELPSDYYERMKSGIVSFEMPIERLEAKFKLGQNRSVQDRQATVDGLMAEQSPDAEALAAFMRKYSCG